MKRIALIALFSLSILYIHAQKWTLLTPLKTGDIVRNCSFIDEENGFAVIQTAGDVLETHDGGQTWKRPWTPAITGNMYDIEMLNLDTIITCGSNGDLFRSTDKGNTWLEINIPSSEYLYALEFIDSYTGFAVGFNGVILKTTDSGSTWQLKESNTTDRLYDIEFSSDLVGMACGWNGTIVKTIDGGETWESIFTGYDVALFNCTFPSDQVGYACGWSQTIIKTEDGGQTWTEQNSGNNTLNYIEFRDENNGIAAGDWGMYYVTSNGGNTWVAETQPGEGGGGSIWGGQYLNDNFSFLTGNGIMLKSTDNTNSWQTMKNSVPNAKYNGLFFHDDNTGYAAGSVGITGEGSNQSGIVYTEDGGSTWEIQAQGSSQGWWDIHFSDDNNGTAIGGVNFAKTSNGGENWSYSTLDFNLTGVATYWHDSNEGVIGGSGLFSGICSSSDGGNSFVSQENTAAKDFYFISDLIGFACTEGSTQNIFKTIDGGVTWEAIPTGHNAGKFSLFWLDENTGWVGANSGVVLKTIDGGETWNFYYAGYDVIGIHFYDENNGFCVDNQSYVYKTTDGGENWEFFLGDSFTMPVAQEGVFTDNYLYLGSWGGDIYRCELICGEFEAGNVTGSFECENDAEFIGLQGTVESQEITWSIPEDWTFLDDEGGVIQVVPGTMDGFIVAEVTNTCGFSDTTCLEVSVTPLVQNLSEFIDNGALCQAPGNVIEIPFDENASTYNWSYPNYWEVEEDGNTLIVEPNSEQGWIYVSTENECGESNQIFQSFTPVEYTDVFFDLEETETCANLEIELSDASPEGGIFSGEYVSDTTLDLNGANSGETYVTYSYTNQFGCIAEITDTLNILSTNIEGGQIIGSDFFCESSIETYEFVEATGFEEISWTYPENWNVIETDNTLEISSVDELGNLNLEASNQCGGLEEFSIQIIPLQIPQEPMLSVSIDQWCYDQSSIFEASNLSAFDQLNYQFDFEEEVDMEVTVFGNSTISVESDPGQGIVNFYVTNQCGISESIFVELEVLDYPESPSFANEIDGWCVGGSAEIELDNYNEGDTILWDLDTDWELEEISNTGVSLTGDPGLGNLEVLYSNLCGFSEASSLELEIYDLPELSLSLDEDSLCLEEIYEVQLNPTGGILEGTGVVDNTISTFFLNEGEPYIYSYNFTDENACSNETSLTLEFMDCSVSIIETRASEFSLYPNPAVNFIQIESQNQLESEYQIYNSMGQLIKVGQLNSNLQRIDLNDFSSGFYTFKLGEKIKRFELLR